MKALDEHRLPIRLKKMLVSYCIFHLLAFGVFFMPWTKTALVLFLASYSIRLFGITAIFHRYFSHRSFRMNRFWQFVFAFVATTGYQRGPLWWSGHHRLHHKYSDTPQDPHSPRYGGWLWSQFVWVFHHYDIRWDMCKDWSGFAELAWLEKNHNFPPILLAIVLSSIWGWEGFFFGFVAPTVCLWQCVSLVNSSGHLHGPQRFDTGEGSRNRFWIALLTFGDGWHNNHHRFPTSARHGFTWWEIDINYYILRLLALIGIVSHLKHPLKWENKVASVNRENS